MDKDVIEQWKKRIIKNPGALDVMVESIPHEVAMALTSDPVVGPKLADAISRASARKAEERAQRDAGRPVSTAARDARNKKHEELLAEKHRRAAAEAAERARRLREQQELREERIREEQEEKKKSIYSMIQGLDAGEKTKLARSGDKDARSILIKDGNTQVAAAVLENPRITLQEIDIVATSRNAPEEILREIAANKEWCKTYSIIVSLANNPKTPIDASLKLLRRLRTRDLKYLTQNKGIPDALRTAAKKFFRQKGY